MKLGTSGFARWLLIGYLAAVAASAETSVDVARRYLGAIERQDWASMEGLLAPQARYRDFSMEHFGGAQIDLQGPAEIVGFWRNASADAGTLSIRLDLPLFFAAGPHLLFVGHSEVVVAGEAWQLPLPEISTRFPQWTHLRVVDGRITDHTDHVDYHAAEERIAAQVAEYDRRHGKGASFEITPLRRELIDAATQYLEALHGDDWEALRGWLDAGSRYLNPTAESLSGSVETASGVDAMLELFQEARGKSGTLGLRFEVESRFLAGPNCFLRGLYHVEALGDTWGKAGERVRLTLPMIVHLRFRNGKITHHVEYMDYASGFASLESP